MRHLKRTAKLGRTSEHRNAMLANLVCSLIEHKRVTTTLAKAKAARSVAEKMVTLGKSGTIHDRRLAVARLHQEAAAKILFKDIAPAFKDRKGGYTRIVKLGPRESDSSPIAFLEWVDYVVKTEAAPVEKTEKPAKAEKPAKEEKTEKAEKPKAEAKPEKPAKSSPKPQA